MLHELDLYFFMKILSKGCKMKNEINGYNIRKWVEYFDETLKNETGIKTDEEPIRKYAVGAILENPYAGKFSKNLDLLKVPSRDLGIVIGERLLRCSNGYSILSYGKACIVGTLGEYEHGSTRENGIVGAAPRVSPPVPFCLASFLKSRTGPRR